MTKCYVYHICKEADNGNYELGYIGVTTDIKARFKNHAKSDTIVGRAIRKYKLDESNIHVIQEFDDIDSAYEMELMYRPTDLIGWNISPGGKGYSKGHIQNPYIRYKISQNKKNKSYKQSEDHYKMMSEKQKGMKREVVECPYCQKIGGYGNMQRWHFFKCKNAPKIIKRINSFDCDGVITLGIYPGPNDVIITGRSFEEKEETLEYFKDKGITNKVYFNPLKFDDKTRVSSGTHKGNTIIELFNSGILVEKHIEDDFDQYKEIKRILKHHAMPTKLIFIDHGGLINLENQRHAEAIKIREDT